MKCSTCEDKNRQQLVYCKMCNAWHCTEHFNSALIYGLSRTLRSPIPIEGRVDVHGTVVEATYKNTKLIMSLVEGTLEYNNHILGTIEEDRYTLSPWKAYTTEGLVGQRETPAGAVGCIIQATMC